MQRWLADSPRCDHDQVRQVVQTWEVIEPQTARRADSWRDLLVPNVNPDTETPDSSVDESLAHTGAWAYQNRKSVAC